VQCIIVVKGAMYQSVEQTSPGAAFYACGNPHRSTQRSRPRRLGITSYAAPVLAPILPSPYASFGCAL
jgi:hypothetical protein